MGRLDFRDELFKPFGGHINLSIFPAGGFLFGRDGNSPE